MLNETHCKTSRDEGNNLYKKQVQEDKSSKWDSNVFRGEGGQKIRIVADRESRNKSLGPEPNLTSPPWPAACQPCEAPSSLPWRAGLCCEACPAVPTDCAGSVSCFGVKHIFSHVSERHHRTFSPDGRLSMFLSCTRHNIFFFLAPKQL